MTLCTAATKRIRPTPHVPTPQPPPLPPAVTGAAFSEEIVQAEDEAETLALHRDEAVMLLLHRDEVLASGLIRCKLHALTIDLAGRFSRTIGTATPPDTPPRPSPSSAPFFFPRPSLVSFLARGWIAMGLTLELS